jgi:hypothetical protein
MAENVKYVAGYIGATEKINFWTYDTKFYSDSLVYMARTVH